MSQTKNIEDKSYVPPPKVKRVKQEQSANVKVVENTAKPAERVKEAAKINEWKDKMRRKLLPLEPLCCMSSAIIREGCGAAAVSELLAALATTAVICFDMWKRNFKLWEHLPKHSIKELFLHPVIYYIICVHNAILLLTVLLAAIGLYLFSKKLIAIKYYYSHVSLIMHLLALMFSLYVLCTPGTIKWTYISAALVFCFSVQIVLEIWAIPIIGACKNFFKMIDTFTSMAA